MLHCKVKLGDPEFIEFKKDTAKNIFLLSQLRLCNSLPNKDFHLTNRVLSKNAIKNFFIKYLVCILTKGGRGTGEKNLDYYNNLIEKFLYQEEGNSINGVIEKEALNPMKYCEFEDFQYIIVTLSHMKINDFQLDGKDVREEEQEIILGILDSIFRIFQCRQNNYGNISKMLDGNVETLKNVIFIKNEVPRIILQFGSDEIEEQPNKDFVGPKEEYEKRLDKYFKHLFFTCSNKASNKNSYYRELYLRITNYNENTKITTEELGIFIEFINKLDIDIFTRESIGDIMSLEEIAKIFEKGINNGFMNHILPKIFKIKISEMCKRQNERILNGEDGLLMSEISEILENNEEDTDYSFKSQLKIETIKISDGIEICGIGEKHYRMHYLVRNGKIISEFKWGDMNNVKQYHGIEIMRIMHKNKYANVIIYNGETIGGRFDDVGKLEDGIDGDKIFRASRDGKEMYISLETGKPIGGEYFSVGKIQDGAYGDKVFAIKEGYYENYISLRKGKKITNYLGLISNKDWQIKNLPFGEKYVTIHHPIVDGTGKTIENSGLHIKINLRTGQEVDLLELTQFELKRRFNTLLTYLG